MYYAELQTEDSHALTSYEGVLEVQREEKCDEGLLIDIPVHLYRPRRRRGPLHPETNGCTQELWWQRGGSRAIGGDR